MFQASSRKLLYQYPVSTNIWSVTPSREELKQQVMPLAAQGVYIGTSSWMVLPGSRPNPDLTAARFLLTPGRKYEQAVKTFQPYDAVKEQNPEARAAGKTLIAQGQAAGPKRRTFVFVNNRLEGNALGTIAAMLQPESNL